MRTRRVFGLAIGLVAAFAVCHFVTAGKAPGDVGPSKVNADAMGEGWFIKLRLDDPKQLDALMDEEAYQRFVEEQH